MAGGSISADPLFNFFSGRTAMLKKEIEVEKKESYLVLLEKMFDTNHFVNKLKIPLAYVKGFQYFAVENPKFTIILNSKNKTATEFLLGELATKYNEMIAGEK
jgi:thymidylate kinase